MESRFQKIDLHMHTTVSDGTDTPKELLDNVKKAGIEFFSVTDHDAVKAGKILLGILGKEDPAFVPGIEFSCQDELGKYHILGYGFDPDHPAIQSALRHGHDLRMSKLDKRLAFLEEKFGFVFSKEDKNSIFAVDNPGKPHIANMMVRYGYAKTKEEAILDYINKAPGKSEHIRPPEAISGILGAGGIPILAHPFYGSGDELILGDEMEARLLRLIEMGLRGVEAYYSGFTKKMRVQMCELATRYDLYITAGSDYHGTNKLVTLGDTGLSEETEYPSGLCRFIDDILQK
ncbi:MAG: PHP domain-containing protein [Clostridia bacterium]|nr:PHP domain-containing protein [Clostridia bacterium]